jgi:hypothetical protein
MSATHGGFCRRILMVLFVGSLGVVASALPAGASPVTTAAFTGTVTAGGLARSGVYVGLVDATSGRITAVTISDTRGSYRFDAVPGGASYRVLFVDGASLPSMQSGLRAQFSPGVDVASKTLSVARQAATVYPATAGATITVSAAMLGRDCDPTVMKPYGNYTNTILIGKDYTGCDLRSARFALSYLSASTFTGANLTNASFFGATLYGADLRLAKLTNTALQAAQLGGANLTWSGGRPVGFDTASYGNTRCPSGVNSDANHGTCAGEPW